MTQLPTADNAKRLSNEQRELETTAIINKLIIGINKNIAQGFGCYRAVLSNRQYNLACNFIHSYLESELGYKVRIDLGGVTISWD